MNLHVLYVVGTCKERVKLNKLHFRLHVYVFQRGLLFSRASYLAPRFCLPPSIAMHSPVMNLALSESRNATNSPTSLGCPTLPKDFASGWVHSMLRFKNASYPSSDNPPVYHIDMDER